MGFLTQTFHALRYKIDYYYIDYKQRYYSTNRNPRIIQTKLQNKQLISLRTFPKDKYLTKPGEFLTLERKSCYQESPLLSTSHNLQQPPDDVVSFLSFDETFILNHSKKNNKANGPSSTQDIRISSVPDLIFNNKSLDPQEPSSCACDCHITSTESGLEGQNPKQVKNSKGVRQRLRQYIRIPSKTIKESSFGKPPSNVDSNILLDNKSSLSLETGNENHQLLEKMTDSPIKSSSPQPNIYSLVTKLSSSSFLQFGSESESKDINPISPKVWKTVLNEISLSAARISTGSPPSHITDARKVSSDFIDAKSMSNNENEPDLFAVNLAQARLKYNINKDRDNSNNLNTMSLIDQKERHYPYHHFTRHGGQRNVSNISAITTTNSLNGTMAMGELYGDNGILAMYNDSENEEEV